MLRWLKIIGLVLAGLVALFVVVGLLLPSGYAVSRSIVVSAEPARVQPLVTDLKRWPEWEPWQEMDPTIRQTFEAKTTGVGAHRSWTGKSGDGEMTYTRVPH